MKTNSGSCCIKFCSKKFPRLIGRNLPWNPFLSLQLHSKRTPSQAFSMQNCWSKYSVEQLWKPAKSKLNENGHIKIGKPQIILSKVIYTLLKVKFMFAHNSFQLNYPLLRVVLFIQVLVDLEHEIIWIKVSP